MNRHDQRKAATHQSLLETARHVIVEKGYDNVEILDITERADVSKATFYKHFPNKEECVRELMLQGFDALVAQIFSDRRTAKTSEVWAIDSVAKAFAWAETNRELMLIMVGGAASSRLNAFGRQYMVEISERLLVEYGPPEEFGPYSNVIMAQVVTGIMIQFLGWWLETDHEHNARQMAELVFRLLRNGLGPVHQ